jgi:hypothetical protein
MKKLGSTLLVAGGAVLATATFYDATLLTHALGLPIEGGEAVVALTSLSLSAVLLLFGILGLRKQPLDGASQRAA